MRPDPKFGWHVIWLTPLVMIWSAIYGMICRFKDLRERKRLDKIVRDNPEIRELSELSGIRKKDSA